MKEISVSLWELSPKEILNLKDGVKYLVYYKNLKDYFTSTKGSDDDDLLLEISSKQFVFFSFEDPIEKNLLKK